MHGFLLIVAIIYVGSYATSLLLNKPLGKIVPIFLAALSLFVYFLTILSKSIRISLWISLVATLIFVSIIIIIKKKNIKKHFINKCKKASTVYLVIVLITLSIAFIHGPDPILWDETAFWGKMCKELFRLDYFYITEATTLLFHYDYPPIIQLTNTLSSILINDFSMIYVYSTMYLATMSFFLILVEEKQPWNFYKLCAIFLFLAIFITAYDTGQPSVFLSLYQDSLLGIVAGFMLYKSINYTFKWLETAELAIYYMYIVLIKQSSLVFIAISIILITIKLIKKPSKSHVLKLFIVCVCLIISYLSWKLAYNNSYARSIINPQFSIENFYLTDIYNIDFFYIITKYIRSILVTNLFCYSYIPVSYLISIILIIAVLIITYTLLKIKIDKKLIAIIVTVGSVYAIFMLASYLFLFKGDESLNLASFRRYLGTGYIVCALIALISICNLNIKIKKFQWNKFWAIVISIELIISFACFPKMEFFNNYKKDASIAKEISERLDKSGINDTTCFVFDKDMNSVVTLQCSFFINNIKIQTPLLPIDYKTNEWLFEKDHLQRVIPCYEYFYINNNDELFWKQYKEIFSNNIITESNTLYKIKMLDNKIFLEKV